MKRDMQNFESSVDWTAHAEALAATLVVPMNVMKCKFPILEDSDAAKAFGDVDGGNLSSASVVGSATARSAIAAVKTGRSPFPFLDDFVQNKLATREGILGAIRGWSIENDGKVPKSITYQMFRNRWCESIGRAHKSNNIMWTIDFAAMNATQGCHDPECRALKFRGKPLSLPDDVRLELSDALFDYELMAQADEAEPTQQKSVISKVAVKIDNVGLPTKNISTMSQFEFDDEEFERALLALTIDEGRTRSKPGPKLT
jgi:DNA-directed primase/polymerase protein